MDASLHRVNESLLDYQLWFRSCSHLNQWSVASYLNGSVTDYFLCIIKHIVHIWNNAQVATKALKQMTSLFKKALNL